MISTYSPNTYAETGSNSKTSVIMRSVLDAHHCEPRLVISKMYKWIIIVLLLEIIVNVLSAPTECTGSVCETNRTCEPLTSSSLEINCIGQRGHGVSCKQRLPTGTKAIFFCKEGFEQTEDPGYNRITCEENGVWDKCPSSCRRLCGIPNPINTTSIVARNPWHATIFRENNQGGEFRAICSGTTISDTIVITAAHCVYDQSRLTKIDIADVLVAVGSENPKLDIARVTDYAQVHEVKQIILHPGFKGLVLNYKSDIAAVILKLKIYFNEYIAPACIDYALSGKITEPAKGTIFTIVGHNISNSGKLEEVKIPSLPQRECIEKAAEDFVPYITDEKLCAGDTDGSVLGFRGFSGAGTMIVQNTSQDGILMYLRGILSVGSITQGIMGITDILVYIDWIKELQTSEDKAEKPQFCGREFITISQNENSKCSTPPLVENGQYIVGGIAAFPSPGTLVSEWTVIKYSCKDGYGLIGEEIAICVSGNWPAIPTCLKKCKALTSSSVQLDCDYNGKPVPCDEPVKAGTKAHLQCKRGYKLPYTPDFDSIICERDGAWDYSIYRCIADCGIARPKGISLAIKGRNAGFQDFPWHVGIYKKTGLDKYMIWCGGSIITNKMVITAAHCFYDPGAHNPNDKSKFAIGAGKIHQEWNSPDDADAQYSGIQNMIIPEAYDDIYGNYGQDIALLELMVTLEFSSLVRPICLNWDFTGVEEEFVAGTKGIVSGWGLTSEGGEVSNNLQFVVLPTVPRQTCLEKTPSDFRPFVTPDKFCAGYLNGTSLCRGDSGGGLALPIYNGDSPVYYLRGIVSVAPTKNDTCDSYKYTAFTRVLSHISWISKHRKRG